MFDKYYFFHNCAFASASSHGLSLRFHSVMRILEKIRKTVSGGFAFRPSDQQLLPWDKNQSHPVTVAHWDEKQSHQSSIW